MHRDRFGASAALQSIVGAYKVLCMPVPELLSPQAKSHIAVRRPCHWPAAAALPPYSREPAEASCAGVPSSPAAWQSPCAGGSTPSLHCHFALRRLFVCILDTRLADRARFQLLIVCCPGRVLKCPGIELGYAPLLFSLRLPDVPCCKVHSQKAAA
jgi:hypothetical protein